MTSFPVLVVDSLCGDVIIANSREGLTTGHDANLKAGEDSHYMHRITMYVYAESGMWFLLNNCEHVIVMMRIPGVSRSFQLAPRQHFDLSYPKHLIRFLAKNDQYGVQIKQDIEHADARIVLPASGTEAISIEELSERRRALIAAYTKGYLHGQVNITMVSCTDTETDRELGGKTARTVEHYRTAFLESVLSKGLALSKG